MMFEDVARGRGSRGPRVLALSPSASMLCDGPFGARRISKRISNNWGTFFIIHYFGW